MIFKNILILSILLCGYSNCITLYTEVENLMGTEIQQCLNCLCHARTGCWNRLTCARYSISQSYWKTAGAPAMNRDLSEDEAYRTCMGDENCILNTVKLYTESFGNIDCNYDGRFDCMDRFAIHIYGDNCHNRNYLKRYIAQFNDCAESIGVSRMYTREVPAK